ncbi:uncharacterized protein LOC143444005 isoform X2 [Arvicanthis niloticus]|uniref:uncharacterized protein LOC143444005 isoform X2 n=1 Tax=Arvicanthis niloticus TaxID=61156 RepID=UPI00403D2E1D
MGFTEGNAFVRGTDGDAFVRVFLILITTLFWDGILSILSSPGQLQRNNPQMLQSSLTDTDTDTYFYWTLDSKQTANSSKTGPTSSYPFSQVSKRHFSSKSAGSS